MILEPYAHPFHRTKITECNGSIHYSSQTALQLIQQACILQLYSTYKGRRDAIQASFDFKQNIPIPIDYRQYICAIPTKSPSSLDCTWVFYNHIHKVELCNNRKQSKIHFYNGTNKIIITSFYQMQQQFLKAGFLLCRMNMQDSPQFRNTYKLTDLSNKPKSL
ncbi:comK family protein [Bacillus clarus]|nr:comK family protein [Bacillus clarus]